MLWVRASSVCQKWWLCVRCEEPNSGHLPHTMLRIRASSVHQTWWLCVRYEEPNSRDVSYTMFFSHHDADMLWEYSRRLITASHGVHPSKSCGSYTLALGGIVITDVIVELLMAKEPELTYSEALRATMIVSERDQDLPLS